MWRRTPIDATTGAGPGADAWAAKVVRGTTPDIAPPPAEIARNVIADIFRSPGCDYGKGFSMP
ncbi:hypothetical protein Vlu01_10600 [Micromonospora lutea]|uniref:Uncharacterized protein n=1 Tax=Micromonospora lutea TaxID=419825 RepID=A0ABQ4IRM5_9ACTN|nr:hypothetical protein Vlu01_10600 [Micromonospora lutea]